MKALHDPVMLIGNPQVYIRRTCGCREAHHAATMWRILEPDGGIHRLSARRRSRGILGKRDSASSPAMAELGRNRLWHWDDPTHYFAYAQAVLTRGT